MKKGILSIAAFVVAVSSLSFADSKEPEFGGQKDVAYSKVVWEKIEAAKLNDVPATLYVGGPPHGTVREVVESTIDGKRVIIKRNYGGKDVSVENVAKERKKYLKAVTIMIKKDGYDPKNNDWFWVKYKPDGSLHTAPNKMGIAGKGAGCIACHASASGNDMVFIHNKEANADITLVQELNK